MPFRAIKIDACSLQRLDQLGEGLEIVHVERIKLALAMDVAAKGRIAREQTPSKRSAQQKKTRRVAVRTVC
jgi:hypothetical protein